MNDDEPIGNPLVREIPPQQINIIYQHVYNALLNLTRHKHRTKETASICRECRAYDSVYAAYFIFYLHSKIGRELTEAAKETYAGSL